MIEITRGLLDTIEKGRDLLEPIATLKPHLVPPTLFPNSETKPTATPQATVPA